MFSLVTQVILTLTQVMPVAALVIYAKLSLNTRRARYFAQMEDESVALDLLEELPQGIYPLKWRIGQRSYHFICTVFLR